MITIFHGEDNAKSRQAYIELRKNSEEPVILPGDSLSLSELILAFSSDSFFASNKDIFIEDFFSKRKLIAKETKEIIQYLQNLKTEQNITFWENKKLTPAALKSFPKAKVEYFSLPQTLFKFIDAIAPNKSIELIPLFHSALEGTEPELIFFMMIRQVRILLALILGSNIEETARLAPWQMGNLQRQLRNFTAEQLKKTYKKLYELDLTTKTGRTSLTLTQAIDIFLLSL